MDKRPHQGAGPVRRRCTPRGILNTTNDQGSTSSVTSVEDTSVSKIWQDRAHGRGRGRRDTRNPSAPPSSASWTNPEIPRVSHLGQARGRGRGDFDTRSGRGRISQISNTEGHVGKLGFRKLERLSKEDGLHIMEVLSKEDLSSQLADVVANSMGKQDWAILIITILGKLCTNAYHAIVVKLLARVCTHEFLDKLMVHIVNIDEFSKLTDIAAFLESLCDLFLGIVRRLPTVACERLTKLIKLTSQAVREDVSAFDGVQNIDDRLKLIASMIEQLKLERSKVPVKVTSDEEASQFKDPPDNFRDLRVNPTVDDIMFEGRPFLRPNIPTGPFQSVEHYLDVNFRLMREDFIRPLRIGINELVDKLKETEKSGKKKRIKVDNVRFYDKVEFREVKQEEQKMGIVVRFDPENKWYSQVNWEFSKRFMYGSLLIFTDNHFADILLGTVASRKDLDKGNVLVEFCEDSHMKNLLNKKYLMVESQVFFEPYAHVLKALQMFDEESFPLVPYIVEGKNHREPPGYLAHALNPMYVVTCEYEYGQSYSREFPVLDEAAWPTAGELGLDQSQYKALIGALTRKVMLIQGPPGTGKTFLGLKVAEILLQNFTHWTATRRHNPILVVCYTNHALDQFLNGILKFTDKIVRVGGGCQEPKLAEKNLKILKREVRGERNLKSMLYELREEFKEVKQNLADIQEALSKLELCTVIVSPDTLEARGVMTSRELKSFDERGSLVLWLLQGTPGFNNRLLEFHNYFFDEHLEDCFLILPGDEYTFSISFEDDDNLYHDSEVGTEYLTHLRALQHQLISKDADPQYLNMDSVHHLRSLWVLSYPERRQLYRSWVSRLLETIRERATPVEIKYQEVRKRLQEGQTIEDQIVMENSLVVGMTTTYAASRQLLLKQLKPRIVIIEEAAEVLESHVVVSLAGDCQHLVLIGDHQQLRPNPAVYELAKKYHLDLSLFERLLNNGVDCVALSTQHRMRPEVAQLICPTIYPNLQNHDSVLRYKPVRGIVKNVFFINHTYHEEEVQEIKSFKNTHEASFLMALVRYLRLQGYDASQITILSTYKGQQHHFYSLRKTNPCLEDVRITVVDNYQGEENDIILLSLVRSNAEDKVGFLKIENRVCVALSRAKMGLYMIGNMSNLLAKGDIWPKVKSQLEVQEAYGENLTMCCVVHLTQLTVKSAGDFEKCPEGGCLEPCKVLMPCGHFCESVCHVMDREHKKTRCTQPCNRTCPVGHTCPGLCYEECLPCIVPKTVLLLCNHLVEIPCHCSAATWKCQVRVKRNLIPCQHECEMQCHCDPSKIRCSVSCRDRLDCGHVCGRTCHLTDDPEHAEYQCRKPCKRKNVDCKADHQCTKVCYEDCDLCSVMIKKILPCGHDRRMQCHVEPTPVDCPFKCIRINSCGHKCTKKCKENCDPCLKEVTKVIPSCKHVQKMTCGEDESLAICTSKCERKLKCGHACTKTCGRPCTKVCEELVESSSRSPCGHKPLVPCWKRFSYEAGNLELLALCKEKCRTELACGHLCKGTCCGCFQGRFHEVCKEKCGRVLICGHPCNSPCAASCPPCSKKCIFQCEHSDCPRRCGEPCVMCMEKCSRKCIHSSCPRSCSEMCTCEPCSEPCSKKLEKCKHDCVGFCGDLCPPKCKICDHEELTTVFFGHEDEDDARFVLLPDCNHVVEAQGLEKWLKGEEGKDEIKLKACPICTTTIMSCKRYNSYLKKHADNVAKVKRKLYGSVADIFTTSQDAVAEVRSIGKIVLDQCPLEYTNALLADLENEVVKISNSQRQKRGRQWRPPVSLVEMRNLLSYCQILKTVKETLKPVKSSTNYEVAHFVENLFKNIKCRSLTRLSDQEASDINGELMRLNRLIQLIEIEHSPQFKYLSASSVKNHRDVVGVVRGWLPYSKQNDESCNMKLKILAKEVSVSISQEEIKTVVAAMGAAQGHWFNCPNGHPYFIGECGGAMQISRCNECGASIGGQDHHLLSSNTLASNIDGATRHAWPGGLH